jgi:predicted nucleic acid-binding protein
MARALADTTVLFAAAYRRDSAHEDALPILRGIDSGSLPEAVDMLDRIEENVRFHVESLTADQFAAAKALFRRHDPLSFVDACLVAYARTDGVEYLYAFDDDFDAADGVVRLDTATNPYDPN